jgi:uncharacterized protein YdhG (YjbR/CyaY superfamily)
MAKTTCASVDDYLASQPDAARKTLERVRGAIRKAIPDAEETLSYQIPTYRVNGVAAIYFAGWKQHFSLYPATQTLVADFSHELAGYAIVKGTIRFDLSKPAPVQLISRIAKHRAIEAAAKARAKTATPNAPRAKKATAKRGKQ